MGSRRVASAPTKLEFKEKYMNLPKISKRLEAAASFSRRGVRIADIGTDHAYLPIYLYATGAISGGVASDINQGPVDRAKANVRGWGADIEVLRTDGLCGIEAYAPDDIFILGMGGELIASILADADWIRDSRYRLVLQPMTHPEILRAYLYGNGFSIIDEVLVKEEKIYHVICAEYSGERYSASTCELFFGKRNIERGGGLLLELLARSREIYEQRIEGKKKACADISEEAQMIEKINALTEEIENDRT